MIQLNLLPDIKQEFIRARRTKRLVMASSIVLTSISLIIFIVLLLVVDVVQKKDLSNIDKDISTYSSQLRGTTNLNQILTVQNQLKSLPALNAQKPATLRLFGYINQLTPIKVDITNLDIDYTLFKITINGSADSSDTINTFADTLKFTTYNAQASDGTKTTAKAFNNVVLSSFNRSTTQVTYSISLNFDPLIFDNTNTASLTVPNIISTRSEVNQPKALFQQGN